MRPRTWLLKTNLKYRRVALNCNGSSLRVFQTTIKDAEDGLPIQGVQLSTIGQAGDQGTRDFNREMLRMASAD